ncbi:MAG TPA: Rieske 2Fe-2S domain-containing protein [Candidatus Dormibacteraeota bacterium]|nr:Rieske 2Fe-2S domain-containing protein [Candidatus Dormibacteraeota bacterium]
MRVAVPLAGLRAGEGRLLTVAGREIAVFLTPAGPRAVDAHCPHAGGPLHDGIVSGTRVTCPLHLRRVDLDTGAVDDCPERVRCYPAVVAGPDVLLDL